eukprot:3916625-Pyramimonas_sp.AAC.1
MIAGGGFMTAGGEFTGAAGRGALEAHRGRGSAAVPHTAAAADDAQVGLPLQPARGRREGAHMHQWREGRGQAYARGSDEWREGRGHIPLDE